MYRIAVIQNEVEMQHSGYVDSVQKYRERFELNVEVVFNRFSSVNLDRIFTKGEDFLGDYDCLIIGTNATSDGDVYNQLKNENNKKILSEFINQGKGLLVCSQKKLISDNDCKGYKARKTAFLPEIYEYNVISRPQSESSADGDVTITSDMNSLSNIQNYVLQHPHNLSDDMIESHCKNNDFQQHFYRDYIITKNESMYYPLLLDNRTDSKRYTMMVASPQKDERIIISTMALDWAGHYELLENTINYLIKGIPALAFIEKKQQESGVFKYLVSEADLQKIAYKLYNSVEECSNSKIFNYHSLFVFSPNFIEKEVSDFWNKESPEQAPGY
jgi:hypothetical protein